jgi:VanZ family protein
MFESRFNTKLLTVAILFTAAVLVFTHLPQGTMPSPLQKGGVDTLQHVLAYGVITFLFLISLRTSPTMLSVLLLFLAVSVIGAFDELTQIFVNRTASVADLAADIVGILSALFFYTMRRRRFPKTTP